MFYVLCLALSHVRTSDWLFVHSLIVRSLVCIYVNQAAHVNLVLINENDDDGDEFEFVKIN